MLRKRIRATLQQISKSNRLFFYLSKSLTYLYLVIYNLLSGSTTLVAGSLTYNTLLALVPTILVFFSIFSVLPHFNELRTSIQDILFNILSPNSAGTLEEVFDNVIAHTNNLGLPSVLSLFVIAFLLIHRIDQTINQNIWKVKRRRTYVSSFTTYWTVISFGPMLLGGIFFAKGYLVSIYSLREDLLSSTVIFVLGYIQIFILWFMLFFTYTFMPLVKVRWHTGLLGSLIATIVLVLCKNIFVYYITTFPSYYVIYGAIAAFPITVFWLYIVWVVILCGAQLTRIFDQSSFYLLLASYMRGDIDDLIETSRTRDIYIETEDQTSDNARSRLSRSPREYVEK